MHAIRTAAFPAALKNENKEIYKIMDSKIIINSYAAGCKNDFVD